MKSVPTFTASIYVGRKVRATGEVVNPIIADQICHNFCDEHGFCVSVTQTKLIYTHGHEPGVIVGVINYPRFPSKPETLRQMTLDLAESLRANMCQQRVSVVFQDETIMLGGDDA